MTLGEGLPSFSCLLILSLLEERCQFSCLYRCCLYGGGYIGQFWANVSKFFCSLSTRGGFLTLPNDDLTGLILCVCISALVLLAFGPFMVGRRMPVFRALPCIFVPLSYKQYFLGGPLPFRWPSAPRSCPHPWIEQLPRGTGGSQDPECPSTVRNFIGVYRAIEVIFG